MYEHECIVIFEVLIVLISMLQYVGVFMLCNFVASYNRSRGTQHDSCNVTTSQNTIIITI